MLNSAKMLALFGAAGNLEIAINANSAAKLLIMGVGNAISIEFYDKKESLK